MLGEALDRANELLGRVPPGSTSIESFRSKTLPTLSRVRAELTKTAESAAARVEKLRANPSDPDVRVMFTELESTLERWQATLVSVAGELNDVRSGVLTEAGRLRAQQMDREAKQSSLVDTVQAAERNVWALRQPEPEPVSFFERMTVFYPRPGDVSSDSGAARARAGVEQLQRAESDLAVSRQWLAGARREVDQYRVWAATVDETIKAVLAVDSALSLVTADLDGSGERAGRGASTDRHVRIALTTLESGLGRLRESLA